VLPPPPPPLPLPLLLLSLVGSAERPPRSASAAPADAGRRLCIPDRPRMAAASSAKRPSPSGTPLPQLEIKWSSCSRGLVITICHNAVPDFSTGVYSCSTSTNALR
jgi:hypothetical protein